LDTLEQNITDSKQITITGGTQVYLPKIMEQKLVLAKKKLDTLEQKITNSRTNYDYRWNKSLRPKNHGTKNSSRGTNH
jgi:hypothetical protein